MSSKQAVTGGVTGLVLAFNGRRLLDECLKSLDFCDEILVVDSGSTDGSLDIAASHGARVLYRAWDGAIAQHRFALTQVRTEWVVTLDQDEYLSPELRENIVRALREPGDAAGFFCPRRSFYFDRFIRHSGWYPDYLLRVYRRDSVEVRGVLPHEELYPKGPAPRLTGDIVHYPYEDLFEHLAKINAYTRTAAGELHRMGKKGGIAAGLGHGLSKFIKQYVVKLGFLDGRAGFLLAMHAFWYAFHKYVRIAEFDQREKRT